MEWFPLSFLTIIWFEEFIVMVKVGFFIAFVQIWILGAIVVECSVWHIWGVVSMDRDVFLWVFSCAVLGAWLIVDRA